jgi:DNA-binding MarR family transcriptional regulator
MRGVTHNGHEELTLRDLLLHLEGDIRPRLAPLRVTPSQAGVLLFLRRHAEAKVTDAAMALGVRLPTMMEMVKTLVRQGWVIKRHWVKDRRSVCLSLNKSGEALVLKIDKRVRQVEATLPDQDRTDQDRTVPGQRPWSHRT